jgi:hypothetical protein
MENGNICEEALKGPSRNFRMGKYDKQIKSWVHIRATNVKVFWDQADSC